MSTHHAATQPAERAAHKAVRKQAATTGAKRAAKTVRKTAAPPVPAPATVDVPKPKAQKADKHAAKPRPQLVRDSFTMPESDFALLATLKSVALGAHRAAKKSELLRAGLHVLAALDAAALVAALDRLEVLKTGRPKKGR